MYRKPFVQGKSPLSVEHICNVILYIIEILQGALFYEQHRKTGWKLFSGFLYTNLCRVWRLCLFAAFKTACTRSRRRIGFYIRMLELYAESQYYV